MIGCSSPRTNSLHVVPPFSAMIPDDMIHLVYNARRELLKRPKKKCHFRRAHLFYPPMKIILKLMAYHYENLIW